MVGRRPWRRATRVRLYLELFLELKHRAVQVTLSELCTLPTRTNAAPSGPSVELTAGGICEQLDAVELVVVVS